MSTLRDWIKNHRAFCNYFIISCFVTIIDIVVSRTCESFTNEVIANSIGVVVGFLIQYVLCTRKVYAGSNIRTGIIFFVTWLVALGLADIIVYIVRVFIFNNSDEMIAFLSAKFCSIVIPFFFTYFARKKLIPQK